MNWPIAHHASHRQCTLDSCKDVKKLTEAINLLNADVSKPEESYNEASCVDTAICYVDLNAMEVTVPVKDD